MRPDKNTKDPLLKVGIVGAVIAALCCFTPLLVVLLGAAGLAAVVGWLDYALFPLLFASLGIIAQALWIQAGKPGPSPKKIIIALVVILSAGLIWLEFRYALRVSAAAALAVAAYAIWLKRNARPIPTPVTAETDPN